VVALRFFAILVEGRGDQGLENKNLWVKKRVAAATLFSFLGCGNYVL